MLQPLPDLGQQNCRRLLGEESREEGQRYHESVSHTLLHLGGKHPTETRLCSFNKRLLEVFKKLRRVAVANDEEARDRLVDDAKQIIQDICQEHLHAVESFIHDTLLRKALSQEIQDECQELTEYLVAAKRFNLEVNSRSKDRVVSFGEKLAGRFMTSLLKDRVRGTTDTRPAPWEASLTNSPACRG